VPIFTFRGFDQEGYPLGGSKKMASWEQMQTWLDGEGVIGSQIFETKTDYKTNPYASVSPKELSIFCKQMSVLFFSQITLMEGVLLLSEQTENTQLKLALQEIYEFMSKNNFTFAESMNMYEHIFGSYLLNMITVGEKSGSLDRVFLRLSDYYDKEGRIRKKVKSAIAYPAILTVLMLAIVVFLIVRILPMFNDVLNNMGGGELPGVTKALLSISSFLSNNFLIILLVIVVIAAAFKLYVRTDKGSVWYDNFRMKAPFVGYMNSRVITARFSRSMSILLKSGVQLLNAFQDALTLVDNKYLKEKFLKAAQKIKAGDDLKDTLSEIEIFPPLFLRMVSIGQKTGNLDEMLDKCANMFDDDVDDAAERLTLMLEPILIIILSIVVGIILISVMLPMIEIMNQIG